MKNSEKRARPVVVGTNTFISVGVFFIVLSIALSFYFSKNIENFFWEARTKSAINIVRDLSKNLGESDLSHWSERASESNLQIFANDTKRVLASVSAVKIYTKEGTLAWTDLKNIQKGTKEDDVDGEIALIKQNGHLIKAAGDATRKELNNKNLLEVWVEIKDPANTTLGFVELYFDSSDITAFTRNIQYTIWIGSLIILGIVLFLLRLVFRQQNNIIIRQAKELVNIIEKSPFGIYTIDAEGTALSINPKMLEFIKKENADEIVGHNVLDMEYVKKTKSEDAIKGALKGIPFVKEITIEETGDELHRLCTATPLFKTDKTLEQVLFTVEDITDRKKLEKEIALHSKNLEVAVNERTKSLQEKIEELEQFQRLTVNREVRMTELKQEIEQMRVKLKELGVDFHPV